jgi:hypothetical protein
MIKDFGKRAEGMGLDSIWMGEHVALFDKNTFGYPGSKDGRIPATFEVVYGHAWKAAPKRTGDGRSIVRFERGRGREGNGSE